jgi:hypothetical protein
MSRVRSPLWNAREIDDVVIAVEGGHFADEIGPYVSISAHPAARPRDVREHDHAYRQRFVPRASEMPPEELPVCAVDAVASEVIFVSKHAPRGPAKVGQHAGHDHRAVRGYRRQRPGAAWGCSVELPIGIGQAEGFHRWVAVVREGRAAGRTLHRGIKVRQPAIVAKECS